MDHEPSEHDFRPPSRFGWGAGVVIAVAVIGVAANLIEPGTPLAIGLFAVGLAALAVFLRSERDREE